MSNTAKKDPAASKQVRESASKLERHIRACGLKPGDRYISADEASQILGQSVTMAQRAMAHLARKKILERRPKAGTFIGPAIAPNGTMPCVHFLMPKSMAQDDMQKGYWEQIQGMRSVLPNVSVQFNFIPNQDATYAQELVEQAEAAHALAGVILVLPSRQLRKHFNQSGIPTVVEGGVEDDLENLCWINADQVQVGQVLASYLIERGHRQLTTIMRDVWSIGEHLIHDGILQAMTDAGLPPNALQTRSTPMEEAAITLLVRNLLQQEHPPTGFICRTEFHARYVREAARSLGLADKVEIVHDSNSPPREGAQEFTFVTPELVAEEQGRIIASMFKNMMENKALGHRGQVMSVKLHPIK